jgi:hypothetical protein
MCLAKKILTISLKEIHRAAIIFDTSESALPFAKEIFDYGFDLINSLSWKISKEIYFLGNSRKYSVSEITGNYTRYCSENKNRCSLIRPTFQEIIKQDYSAIVLLSAGPIFDIEDWCDTPTFNKMISVVFDNQPLTSATRFGTDKTSIGDISNIIEKHIKEIVLGDDYVIPIKWKRGECILRENKLLLNLGHDISQFDIGFIGPQNQRSTVMKISYIYGNEEIRNCELIADEGLIDEPEYLKLKEEEFEVFNQVLAIGEFKCPRCKRQHRSDIVHCDKIRIVAPIYESIEYLTGRGFVLFTKGMDLIKVHHHIWDALSIGNDVAVRIGNQANIYRFNHNSKRWLFLRQMKQYENVAENVYAIFI